MDVIAVALLSLMAILILVFVIAVLYNKYNDLKEKYDKLRDNLNEEVKKVRARMLEVFGKSELKSELFEAWRVFHLCNKQRRVFRSIIINAAEYEATKGNITVIKNKKDKRFAVLTNEHLQYLLDIERRYQYLDAKMKLEETPETRDSFERANYEKYLEEFKANKNRLQKIVDDYEKHELEVKDEKR